MTRWLTLTPAELHDTAAGAVNRFVFAFVSLCVFAFVFSFVFVSTIVKFCGVLLEYPKWDITQIQP